MELDKELRDWGLEIVDNPSAVWELVDVKHVKGQTFNMYFKVLDESGRGKSAVTCGITWHDPEKGDQYNTAPTDEQGEVNFPMSGDSTIRLDPSGHGAGGPYTGFVGDLSQSDALKGMGLPLNRPVEFHLTFKPKQVPATPREAAIAAALRQKWMPINKTAALFKFAKANKLGSPQTDEFEFSHGGNVYVAQVFEDGIVYTKKGDYVPSHMKVAKKPKQ